MLVCLSLVFQNTYNLRCVYNTSETCIWFETTLYLHVQVTLEEQNDASFKEISQWVRNRQFFDAQQQLYRSARVASLDGFQPDTSTCGTHIVGSFNKKLHTALLFLGQFLHFRMFLVCDFLAY